MKIVTVNVPESYIDAIEKLVGEHGLYPSRSELIRCAVREFLFKELEMAKNIHKYKNKSDMEEFDDNNYIKIPINDNGNNRKKKDLKLIVFGETYYDAILNELIKKDKTLTPLRISKSLGINHSFLETKLEELHETVPKIVRKKKLRNHNTGYYLSKDSLKHYLRTKNLDLEFDKFEQMTSNYKDDPIPQFKTYKIIKRLEY